MLLKTVEFAQYLESAVYLFKASVASVAFASEVISYEFILNTEDPFINYDDSAVNDVVPFDITLLSTNDVSAYAFVAKSVETVGVARFVIFCEFKETELVGAVMSFSVVEDVQYRESAVYLFNISAADVASPTFVIF